MKIDDQSGYYTAPHWWHSCNPTTDRRYPYLYKQGQTLQVSRALWNVPDGIDTSQSLLIQGVTTGGLSIAPASATYDSTNDWIIATNLTAMNSFTADVTAYYNTFQFDWFMSDDGGVSWVPAGTSQNEIFVTLSDPDTAGIVPYRTVCHLACSNPGATDSDTSVANTFSLFTGRNVCKWNQETPTTGAYNKLLYYYEPGTTFDLSQNPVTVAGLLKVGSGECVAWAYMLQDTWSLNGVNSDYIKAVATGSGTSGKTFSGFLVRHWHFNTQTSPISGTWNLDWQDVFYPGYTYGDLVDLDGLPGQNDGTPSQKVFNNHQFLKYGSTYYDPSYGGTYANEMDFQVKAISGFIFQRLGATYAEKNSTTLHISFP